MTFLSVRRLCDALPLRANSALRSLILRAVGTDGVTPLLLSASLDHPSEDSNAAAHDASLLLRECAHRLECLALIGIDMHPRLLFALFSFTSGRAADRNDVQPSPPCFSRLMILRLGNIRSDHTAFRLHELARALSSKQINASTTVCAMPALAELDICGDHSSLGIAMHNGVWPIGATRRDERQKTEMLSSVVRFNCPALERLTLQDLLIRPQFDLPGGEVFWGEMERRMEESRLSISGCPLLSTVCLRRLVALAGIEINGEEGARVGKKVAAMEGGGATDSERHQLHIDLDSCNSLSDSSLTGLLESKCSPARSLRISLARVGDDGLIPILRRSCKTITSLELQGCRHVSGSCLSFSLYGWPAAALSALVDLRLVSLRK